MEKTVVLKNMTPEQCADYIWELIMDALGAVYEEERAA